MAQHTYHDYDHLRPLIQQGDVVAFYRGNSLGDRIYSFGLRLGGMGPHTHIALIRVETFNGVDRVWVIEEEPGVGGHVRPLSHYKKRAFDVLSCPIADPHLPVDKSLEMMNRLTHYSKIQICKLIGIGIGRALRKLFTGHRGSSDKADVDTPEQNALVCSTYVSEVLKLAGWDEKYPGVWPSAIYHQIREDSPNGQEPRLKYRPKG